MYDTEDRLHEAVLVGGMDVASGHIVMQQPVDDIGALALGGAEYQREPEEAALFDEDLGAAHLHPAEVIERMAGVKRGFPDLELLAVAQCVECLARAPVDLRQFYTFHGRTTLSREKRQLTACSSSRSDTPWEILAIFWTPIAQPSPIVPAILTAGEGAWSTLSCCQCLNSPSMPQC